MRKVKASHNSAQVQHLYELYFMLLKKPALSDKIIFVRVFLFNTRSWRTLEHMQVPKWDRTSCSVSILCWHAAVGLLSLPLNKSNDRIVFEQFCYYVSSSQMFLRVVLVLKRLSSHKVESVLEIRIDGFSKYNIAECYNDGSASLMMAVSESELFAQDSCFYSGVPGAWSSQPK